MSGDDQAIGASPNPDYDPWQDAHDIIASHLQEDDSAYADRLDAEAQAARTLDALRERGLVVTCPTYEANVRAELACLTAALDEAAAREAVLREALIIARRYMTGPLTESLGRNRGLVDRTLANPSPRADDLLAVAEKGRAFRETGFSRYTNECQEFLAALAHLDSTEPEK